MYSPISLKYSVNELEPYIDGETIMIHYGKHYMNYLNKLNEILSKYNFNFAIDKEFIFDNIDKFNKEDQEDILYNLGGVVNQERYFSNMDPSLNNLPMGSIKEAIDSKYGNYENFKQEFIKKAMEFRGSGYVFLVLTEDGDIDIVALSNQDSPYRYGLVPIMAMDIWEHSYYLKHQNRKEDYFNDFFEVVNYSYINNLYEDEKM